MDLIRRKNLLKAFLLYVCWSLILPLAASAKKPNLQAVPQSALLGVPAQIRVTGVKAGDKITLRAQSEDGNKISWASSALFVADRKGIIDISIQAPVSGDYTEVDPAGLFWSMKPQNLEKKGLAALLF